MDELLNIHTEEIQLDGNDTYNNHRYEPTSYEVLDILFKNFTLSKTDCVVDFGSGLGRLNFYIEHFFSVKSVGVELNTEYYKRSLINLEKYSGNKSNIEFRHVRAEKYKVSEFDTVFYFFNPFSSVIFRQVLNNITLSYLDKKRDIKLIIYYPEVETTNYINSHTNFKLIDEICVIEDIRKNKREKIAIYELNK